MSGTPGIGNIPQARDMYVQTLNPWAVDLEQQGDDAWPDDTAVTLIVGTTEFPFTIDGSHLKLTIQSEAWEAAITGGMNVSIEFGVTGSRTTVCRGLVLRDRTGQSGFGSAITSIAAPGGSTLLVAPIAGAAGRDGTDGQDGTDGADGDGILVIDNGDGTATITTGAHVTLTDNGDGSGTLAVA